jgi:hypothetical protein
LLARKRRHDDTTITTKPEFSTRAKIVGLAVVSGVFVVAVEASWPS